MVERGAVVEWLERLSYVAIGRGLESRLGSTRDRKTLSVNPVVNRFPNESRKDDAAKGE